MATRSGRITKPTTKAQQASSRAAIRRTPPRVPAKKVPRGPNDRPPTSKPATAKQRSVIPQSEGIKLTSPTSVALVPQPHAAVERVKSEGWASSPLHISFVYNAKLPISQDTETITLNLIDYMIRPENWNPGLRYNILSAACFFFSSILTGQCTSPDQIANAIQVDPQLALQVADIRGLYDRTMRQQVMKAMEVNAENVERGYGILYERRVDFKNIVGKFIKNMDELPAPAVNLAENLAIGPVIKSTNPSYSNDEEEHGDAADRTCPSAGSTQQPASLMASKSDASTAAECGYDEATELMTSSGETEEVMTPRVEEEKASEVDLDLFELDDFDRFVAENE